MIHPKFFEITQEGIDKLDAMPWYQEFIVIALWLLLVYNLFFFPWSVADKLNRIARALEENNG